MVKCEPIHAAVKLNNASDYRANGLLSNYRVAQNKIPHQTICNIFATSGQILKILEAV